MTTFALSLPRGIKSPVKTSRLALSGIRMSFFRKNVYKSNIGALGCIIA